MALLDDLVVQTALFPLVVGVAAVGVVRLAGGRTRGPRLAAAGVAAAFLAAYALIVGLPALPPPSSMGRLFWSAVAGLVIGVGADLAGLDRRRGTWLLGAWVTASLLWIALPVLPGSLDTITAAVLLLAGGWIALSRTAGEGEGAATPGVALLAAAVAVGGVALVGASASVAQLAFALAAATGGLLLWNWPVERHAWGNAGQAALGILVLLAATLTFFSSAHAEALLLVLPAFFADRLRDRLPLPRTAAGRAMGTVALTAIALVPAVAAVGVAFLLSAGSDVSGY
ncbi:membrane protein (plasmid) [Azospirillum argentinense]|uniref:Membrane protein n=1 Tax=Azospirillum argentinense TaxID=2970906 RepID=A0A060DNK1_9PROT|nr:hypothetical protein [Azospirillum argentinense]AIB15461.1 membrane protein [Azospirillum argentinense]EZQ04246.1 membrane protein [Azospirillum argentinense]PNQ96765.1 hypothetical protein C1S70_22085 [Azospirillum argentinense]